MFDHDISNLDATATLARFAQAQADVDRAEVDKLRTAAHWADLHGVVDRPGPALPGCEQLVTCGGAGTPQVAEFCFAELGATIAVSDSSARRLVAAALDLRHRLPRLWQRVQAGQVKAWIARQVTETTRHLSPETVAVVDTQIAPYADRLSWSRLHAIVDAAWMQTDPDAATAADQTAQDRLGVWVDPSTEHGTKTVLMTLHAPDAIRFDATIDRCADGLKTLGDDRGKDLRRAAAVAVVANPQAALNLYDAVAAAVGVDLQTPHTTTTHTTDTTGSTGTGRRVDSRPPVTLYVHLAEASIDAGSGVGRVEGVGPVTLNRLQDWLTNSTVTVKPVIDLNRQAPIDGYEIPHRLREAVHLRTPVDCFPYATNTSRGIDIDHTIPYLPPDTGRPPGPLGQPTGPPDQPTGPPGQTRLDNLAPMTRRHHRIKTFSHWQVHHIDNGIFVWRNPHGHYYLVDHTGTRPALTA